jgi:NAD-dependent deacetylase sirtuin 4
VVHALAELLRASRSTGSTVCVLTGAGCSTESGIPDYRGPGTMARARNPIQHRQFEQDAAWRARYWARSALGWPRVAGARPNPAHRALAELGWPIVTQNVDRLHHKAGSPVVIELHGALAEVVCLGCGSRVARDDFQVELLAANPGLARRVAADPAGLGVEAAPDGDAELDGLAVVPACRSCGGVLKPDVVFFGGNVPRERVDAASERVRTASALLVVGSSLTVFSGYRFVKRAAEWGIPVAIVNLGPTRGDPLAAMRVDAPAGELLPELARALGR